MFHRGGAAPEPNRPEPNRPEANRPEANRPEPKPGQYATQVGYE
jgi:hypothetical protein